MPDYKPGDMYIRLRAEMYMNDHGVSPQEAVKLARHDWAMREKVAQAIDEEMSK